MSDSEPSADEVPTTSDDTTGISVHSSHSPLAWMLFFVSPVVAINEEEHPSKWGKQDFPLDPGTHEVEVYFNYFFTPKCCLGKATVEVKAGEVAELKYEAPFFMFSAGTITQA